MVPIIISNIITTTIGPACLSVPLFPPHILSGFVRPLTQIRRVPQPSLYGPLKESNLHDQRRPDPLHILHVLGRHPAALPATTKN